MILCDTREQKNKHILDFFEKKEIPFTKHKVNTGDYMNTENMTITVERKRDLQELLNNLKTSDSSRFWREIRRSKEEGIKMIILCEHGGKIRSIKDVATWKSKYSKVTGRQLMEEMYRAHISYGVEFLFCDKRSTGRRIAELLGVNYG